MTFAAEVVVERIHSQLSGGCIFTGRRKDDGNLLRVRVQAAGFTPEPGNSYAILGLERIYTDRFGREMRQIDVKLIKPVQTAGALLGPWLERIHNVGRTRSSRLVDAFGDGIVDILSNPANLSKVAAVLEPDKPALATRIAAQIYASMLTRSRKESSAQEELAFLKKLEEMGVTSPSAARQMWRLAGGSGAADRLLRNPYLAASVISWREADHLGRRLLAAADGTEDIERHPARLLGAVDSVWRDILADGDTAASPDHFRSRLSAKKVDADITMGLAIDNRSILAAGCLLRAPGAAWLEDDLTARLRKLESVPPNPHLEDIFHLEAKVRESERRTGLILTDEQRVVVLRLLRKPVGILQGGAGVGKTTVMKVLVDAWEGLGGNIVMGALAGKAALLLSRGTSTKMQPRIAFTLARTIRMLNLGAAAMEKGQPIPSEGMQFNSKTLLILDEASMLDTPGLREVVRHLPDGARILLVGDQGQLPPIGIGRCFYDLVKEGSRVVSLTRVLRTAEDSLVPYIAAEVRAGKVPNLKPLKGHKHGVFIVESYDRFQEVYSELLARSDEVMVVAARRETVDSINQQIVSKRRDPSTPLARLGPLATVAVGDKVVCTRNRYRDGLFNGLLGQVTSLTGGGVNVLWNGETVPRLLDTDAAADVELAFGITCHRAQGAAADSVIVMVENSQLVTREWLYTAITRTRQIVILIGNNESIEAAVRRQAKRVTGFQI